MGKYVHKYFYKCPVCGFETYSYRDCIKQNDTMICAACWMNNRATNSTLKEIGREYKETTEDDIKSVAHVSTDSIKPFFDVATCQEITSKSQIKDICKKNGWVYGDIADLKSDAKRNKKYLDNKFTQGLTQEIRRAIG